MGSMALQGKATTVLVDLINFEFDAIDITAKTDDGPTEVKYFKEGLSGTLVATISITYDGDGDIKTVVRVDG